MSTLPSQSLDLVRGEAVLPVRQEPGNATLRGLRATRAEARQKAGKGMILAGFVITIAGVLLYCAVCFAGGMGADMGDILLENALPFSRGTLGVLALGTLVWLVGSFTYLQGAMDAEEDAGEEGKSTAR